MKTNSNGLARSTASYLLLGLATTLVTASCVGTIDLDDDPKDQATTSESDGENDGVSSTSGGSTDPSDGGSGPTTQSDAEVCEAYCAYVQACDGPNPECMPWCLEFVADFDDNSTCKQAATETLQCYGDAPDCEPPDCGLAELALIACVELGDDDDDGCGAGGGGGIGDDHCFFETDCGGAARELSCVETTCTCVENGVEIAECEVEGGACGELWGTSFDLNKEFVESCCGWTDVEW
jgi:hypothetical protein